MPQPDPAPASAQILPLAEEGYGSATFWKKQIDAATEHIKSHKEQDWDTNLKSYLGKTLGAKPLVDTIVAPRDFPFVEQKAAQLFFQTPEVHLTGKQSATQDAAPLFASIVNHYLSEEELNVLSTMNEVSFDALCPSGLMCSKIGLEVFTQGGPVDIKTGNQIPDPDYEAPEADAATPVEGGLPGQILGLGAQAPGPPMIDETRQVPNIVHRRYFWERISPAAILLPVNFSSSTYDKAPWLGFRFRECYEVVRKRYQLKGDDEKLKKIKADDNQDIRLIGDRRDQDSYSLEEEVEGVEIWYRASTYDPSVGHPEKFRQLVFLKGKDDPVVHRDSPYQYTDQMGKLVGMKGNPIHIGALRYVSDSNLPPSECTISRPINEELNRGRTQMFTQRDRSQPMRLINLSAVGGEKGVEAIKQNIQQGLILVKTYEPNNPPVIPVGLAAFPRENFEFNAIADRDLGIVWAMGSNQLAQEGEGAQTATEVSKMDQWATTRLDKERKQILLYFVAGVRKLASLIQQFATAEEEVEIVGPDLQPRLQAWNKDMIQGEFAFKINPDSSIRLDQPKQQERVLKLYELLGKDPHVKRVELLVELCRQWNLDPAKIIEPKPPQQGPDPAKLSFAAKPEFMDPTLPGWPIIKALLKEAGFHSLDVPDPATGKTPEQEAREMIQQQQAIMAHAMGGPAPAMGMAPGMSVGGPGAGGASSPAGIGPGSPPHPGAMPHMDHISKHHADQSGNLPGPRVQ